MLPVMIMMLVEVLEGGDVMPYLYWWAPAALLVAFAWTAFRMRLIPVELAVSAYGAGLRTAMEVVLNREPGVMGPVLDVRMSSDHLQMAIGEAVYELPLADWPEGSDMVDALRAAREEMAALTSTPPDVGVHGVTQ